MKKVKIFSFLFLLLFFGVILGTAFCQSKGNIEHIKPSKSPAETPQKPTPSPPLLNVQEEKKIKPGVGLGSVKFKMSIDDVEKFYGRGEIVPEKTDLGGNTTIRLVYKEEGLEFKFMNGVLVFVSILNPLYATEKGTHPGGDVGDAIREFGSNYQMDRSIVQDADPDLQSYTLYFGETVAVSAVGKIIVEMQIKDPRPPKPKRP